jgi:hypothetical protein
MAVAAAALLGVLWSQRQKGEQMAWSAAAAARPLTQAGGALPAGQPRLLVVGTGMTAAAFVHALGAADRARVTVREASQRVGGQALSCPGPLTHVSTAHTPQEFGAWIFDDRVHTQTAALLVALGVRWKPLPLITPESLLWTPAGTQPLAEAQEADPGPSTDPDVWFARTGWHKEDTVDVAPDIVAAQRVPAVGSVPTGFGWQDVVLRALGRTPVEYGRRLAAVETGPGGAVRLQYASGDEDDVHAGSGDVVLLTLSPPQMARVGGLPAATAAAIRSSFVTLPVGILYLTYAGTGVWWPATGWTAGCVLTTLRIGRVTIVGANTLRCSVSGETDVTWWNTLLVTRGTAAVGAAVAEQLSTVFGVTTPPPASASFLGWPQGISLWRTPAGADRDRVLRLLQRPWGADVPIHWASADLSATPGWVQGAVEAGQEAASRIV